MKNYTNSKVKATLCHFLDVQMMELSLPAVNKGVSPEQRLAEAEGYYQLLRGQVQVGVEEESEEREMSLCSFMDNGARH